MKTSLLVLSFLLSTILTVLGQNVVITGHFDTIDSKSKIVSIDVLNLIPGLPTYFLINKKGKIVSNDAPRLLDSLTKIKIIELLDEKLKRVNIQ